MTEHTVEHRAKGRTYEIKLIEQDTKDGTTWSFRYNSQNAICGRLHPKPISEHGFSNRREAEEAAHLSISIKEH